MKPRIEVMTGGGAAWRARYLYVDGCKVAHIGVDPHDGVRPTLFGSLLGKEFHMPLPTVRWIYPCNPVRLRVYGWVQWFWHNMDGRYGWGSEARKRRRGEA